MSLRRYEYHWADGTQVKKAIKVSAPEYVDYLMTWVQNQLDDESIFPSKIGVPFPKNFQQIVKNVSFLIVHLEFYLCGYKLACL